MEHNDYCLFFDEYLHYNSLDQPVTDDREAQRCDEVMSY